MRLRTRAVAASLVLGMALTACGGHSSSVLPAAGGPMSQQSTPGSTGSPSGPRVIAAVPHTYGRLAVSDLGRRQGSAPVAITVTLNYNHQAELDQLVANQANPSSPEYHHFLTTAEFNNYYAPTAAQYAQAESALRAQGFTITGQSANRTLLQASAPSSVVEHAFQTEMHTVNQGQYGERYMNVKPATLPSSMNGIVRDMSLSNVVVAHTRAQLVQPGTLGALVARSQMLTQIAAAGPARRRFAAHPRTPGVFTTRHINLSHIAAGSNVVTNPGFETGRVNDGWIQCGNVNAAVVRTHPHSGSHDERSGNGSSEPNGDEGVCQQVTIPTNGQLSFYAYQLSDEADTSYAWQEADLLDQYGDVVDNFYYSVNNHAGWVNYTEDLSAYAGGTYYLYFGVHGDGYPYLYTQQYIDDVSLTAGGGSTPTPAPTPTPTQAPTPTPHPTATPTQAPTPTPKPTATPTQGPTPTPKPTATPTQAPTPTPAPTATPGGGCTGSAADNGPLNGSNGWLATGVAKAFDYPVQHGCNGAGETAAVEIDTAIKTSDVSSYLSAAGVTQTGTITNVSVGGAPTNESSSDYVETALDVETISGLAPGANIRVYYFASLSDQNIEAGYNQAVSDGIASVVNSSFGGCESSDTSMSDTTNQIAEQAAAKGMTFSASSGDSGSDECSTGNNPPGVSSPAGDPYFVAVGAVNFTDNSNGSLATITAGTDSSNGFSSGGGVSTYFALPSYQSGVSGINTSGRNSPDVSLPGVGVMVYAASQGGQIEVDGTSWSSPEFTAFVTEVNELHGSGSGFLNPALYSAFNNTYTNYTDVTSGSNGAYNAGTGYDLVTGIGAPKGWTLANAL